MVKYYRTKVTTLGLLTRMSEGMTSKVNCSGVRISALFTHIQVCFINFIPMQCFATSAARYLVSKIQ